MSIKVVLLGDSAVGKSSLVARFASDTFNPRASNTIGAAFVLKPHTANGTTATLDIWDTAGQERYRSLAPMYYRGAKVALVCFSLAEPGLLDSAKYWVDRLRELEIAVYMVGTKLDLLATQNGSEDLVAEQYCEENELRLFRTSAKLGEGVDAVFDAVVEQFPDPGDEQRPEPPIVFSTPRSKCC